MTDNEVEWRALATMVGLAQGFTLGFVVADVPTLLDATVARLTEVLGAPAVATSPSWDPTTTPTCWSSWPRPRHRSPCASSS